MNSVRELEVAAFVVVALAGLYLCGLGVTAVLMPDRARRFLFGFVGSQVLHYVELFLRFAAGAAFITYAPHMLLSGVFWAFGWLLIVSTVGLLLVPWQWHQRFAHQTVPRATRYIALIGVVSLAGGGLILTAALLGGNIP